MGYILKPLLIRNNFGLIFSNLLYFLNNKPDTKKPLSTKNKSTPIHPIFEVKGESGKCLSKPKIIEPPLKTSNYLNLLVF